MMKSITSDSLFEFLQIQDKNINLAEQEIHKQEQIREVVEQEIQRNVKRLETVKDKKKAAMGDLTAYQSRKKTISILSVIIIIWEVFGDELKPEIFPKHIEFLKKAFHIYITYSDKITFSNFCNEARKALIHKDWYKAAMETFIIRWQATGYDVSDLDTECLIQIPDRVLDNLNMFRNELQEYKKAMDKQPDTADEYLQYFELKKKFE